MPFMSCLSPKLQFCPAYQYWNAIMEVNVNENL